MIIYIYIHQTYRYGCFMEIQAPQAGDPDDSCCWGGLVESIILPTVGLVQSQFISFPNFRIIIRIS